MATCQLSSQFEFGPTHIDEGVGIRGNTVGLFDPNIYAPYLFQSGSYISMAQTKVVAEAKAAENAGGDLGGKYQ